MSDFKSVVCPRCKGRCRVRREPITWAHWIIPPIGLLRALIENDDEDDQFWIDCPLCRGVGLVRIKAGSLRG